MVDDLQRVGGRGFLDNSGRDDDLYTIHGIAIGAGDVTLGSKSGERKYWSGEVLRESANTLEGKQIVANHENRDIYSVVGSITDAGYSEEKQGVVFQGVVDEELLAKRINRGWLDVSPRIIHTKGEVDERGIKHPDEIRQFDNLALVSKGAAQSNEVMIGETDELSLEELQSHFDDEPDHIESEFEELQENIKYENHLYDNPEGAEGASQGLGCEGYHEVDFGDETWYMPCQNRDKFLQNMKGEEEAEAVEELQLSEARTPEYDGTEESSWGDVSKDLSAWVDALGYDNVETVDDLTESQKSEVANHTLLGDPDSDTWQELSYFPVVNPNTGNLNRGALEAVRSGRGQAADIPQSTYESAYETAGRLLNENWDTDVEEELAHGIDETELKRMASQMASLTSLTREESKRFMRSVSPYGPDRVEPLIDVLVSSYGLNRDKAEKGLKFIGLSKHMEEEMQNGNGAEEDLRAVASVVADEWNTSTGDALQVIDSLNPEKGGELPILAGLIAERSDFEGVDAADIMDVFDDLRGEGEAEENSLLNKIVR